MPSNEDIQQQQELLLAYRRTLAVLLKQQALAGEAHVEPQIMHGIVEARENIARIKQYLIQWGMTVEDSPSDNLAALPLTTPYIDEQKDYIQRVFQCAEEISQWANDALIENQKIITKFLKDPTSRFAIHDDFIDLFYNQQYRNKTMDWLEYLSGLSSACQNPHLKEVISQMAELIKDIRQVFYQYNPEIEDLTSIPKGVVVDAFGEDSEKTDDKRLKEISLIYLEALRRKVDRIGGIVGHLRAMSL